MTYSNDQDLLKIRPKILSHGETDWEEQHVEAYDIINRELEARWYKQHADDEGIDWKDTPFNPSLVDASYLRRLACFKALELIYRFLMTDTPDPSGFERHMEYFAEEYERELQKVLVLGLGYDWDASGRIESDERLRPRYRRLMRT